LHSIHYPERPVQAGTHYEMVKCIHFLEPTMSRKNAAYKSGRHFLQIPGPTNVPDRVLRAMDMPTMDHRSPSFGELGRTVLTGCQAVFQTSGPVVI